MEPLAGKVALVTGASRGIGRAIALELAAYGADVAINYFRSPQAAQEVVRQVAQRGRRAIALKANVAREEEARAMVERAVEALGRLDILVNNAGINRDATLLKMTGEQWREVIETNVNGLFYCTSAALPHLIRSGGGKIINIGSILGQLGNIGQINYTTSKAAVVGFTRTAALELLRYNITVNAVCPGFIATEMVAALPEHRRQRLVERVPMGRLGRPEEVAALVRHLVVEQEWTTGQCFSINGGQFVAI